MNKFQEDLIYNSMVTEIYKSVNKREILLGILKANRELKRMGHSRRITSGGINCNISDKNLKRMICKKIITDNDGNVITLESNSVIVEFDKDYLDDKTEEELTKLNYFGIDNLPFKIVNPGNSGLENTNLCKTHDSCKFTNSTHKSNVVSISNKFIKK